jgi:hypothetical protein
MQSKCRKLAKKPLTLYFQATTFDFMALIFQIDDKGRARPKIQCDSCGGIIEDYTAGVALLETKGLKPGAITEPIFHCAGCEQKETHQHAMPIDHFMLYVLNNIQLSPTALEEARHTLKSLTSP